jgi:OTU domain-containing protein 6
MDELLSKHRNEKRDLVSKITQKKKNATKKTRKGVNDECERLERELAERQAAEIEELEPQDPDRLDGAVDGLSLVDPAGERGEEGNPTPQGLLVTAAASPPPSEAGSDFQSRTKKPNRQKARLARRAAEQEAAANAAALEAKDQPDRREQELSEMKRQMENLKLRETLIRPDGHCLFSACAHSMPSEAILQSPPKKEPYQRVRASAADFMSSHPDDFAPFLEEPLDTYVTKIRDTAEWGGQLELQAIARSYNLDINVLQADGRIEKISSGSSESQKRHMASLLSTQFRLR